MAFSPCRVVSGGVGRDYRTRLVPPKRRRYKCRAIPGRLAGNQHQGENVSSEKGTGGGGIASKAGAVAHAPGSGRFIGSAGLTDKQKAFVSAYVANGANALQAARAAGYADPKGDSYRLTHNDAVMAAIRGEVDRRLRTEGVAVAFGTLLDVATDKGQSGAARVAASRELMRVGGYHDAAPELGEKPLAERTLAELDAFISGGTERLLAMQAAEARTIEGDSRRITLALDAVESETPLESGV